MPLGVYQLPARQFGAQLRVRWTLLTLGGFELMQRISQGTIEPSLPGVCASTLTNLTVRGLPISIRWLTPKAGDGASDLPRTRVPG